MSSLPMNTEQKIGMVFVALVLMFVLLLIFSLAVSDTTMKDCEPQGGLIVMAQGRKVCLSKELLEQIRKDSNETHHLDGSHRHRH